MSGAGDIISRVYGGFRGVDFRGEEINLVRSPDSVNMWKDYKETDSIRTRPDFKVLQSFNEPVYGIFFYNNYTLVHSGTKLYKVASGAATAIYTKMNSALSDSFIYNDILYIKDGKNYLQYDGATVTEVVGFIPTTSIARKPSGGGTIYQDVNYLTGYRYNTFLADGESKEFLLDAKNIDNVVPVVTVDDKAVTGFEVDYAAD